MFSSTGRSAGALTATVSAGTDFAATANFKAFTAARSAEVILVPGAS
eukprot:CAMPEP_0179131642 /NCGR_PEP_ID=MMETSP0796-20121207/62541_1 /TAXON_ID=73915 /ORGANISM="Pyrodinium bahamense, Strain pbaha01" /LENGTH=46 /DNA_ID= /DNA_START= /DNA_END= /DNA_ORIENTATION=